MRILETSTNILEVGICYNWVHLVMDLNMFFFWQVQNFTKYKEFAYAIIFFPIYSHSSALCNQF